MRKIYKSVTFLRPGERHVITDELAKLVDSSSVQDLKRRKLLVNELILYDRAMARRAELWSRKNWWKETKCQNCKL